MKKLFALAISFLLLAASPSAFAQAKTITGNAALGLLADKMFFSPIERFLHRRWGLVQ